MTLKEVLPASCNCCMQLLWRRESNDVGRHLYKLKDLTSHICAVSMKGFYYRDNIIEPNLVLFVQWYWHAFIFKDGDVCVQCACIVRNHHQRKYIHTLPRSALSDSAFVGPPHQMYPTASSHTSDPSAVTELQSLAKVAENSPSNTRRLIHSMNSSCDV